jgi:hypothetical protein
MEFHAGAMRLSAINKKYGTWLHLPNRKPLIFIEIINAFK